MQFLHAKAATAFSAS